MCKKIQIILFYWIIPLALCVFFAYSIVVATAKITFFSRKQTIDVSPLFPSYPPSIITTYDYKGLPLPFIKINPDTENSSMLGPQDQYNSFYIIQFFINIVLFTAILMAGLKKILKKINEGNVIIKFIFSFFYIMCALFPTIESLLAFPEVPPDLITAKIFILLFAILGLVMITSNFGIIFRQKWSRIIHLYLGWPYTFFLIYYYSPYFRHYQQFIPSFPYGNDLALLNMALFFLIIMLGSAMYLTSPSTKGSFQKKC